MGLIGKNGICNLEGVEIEKEVAQWEKDDMKVVLKGFLCIWDLVC